MHSQPIKKRHWCLASLLILFCSWITHTTTASISDGVSRQQIDTFASLLEPNNPEAALQDTQTLRLSDIIDTSSIDEISEQIAAPALFDQPNITATQGNALFPEQAFPQKAPQEDLRTITHKVKKGESLGVIFNKHDLDLSLPHKISKNELGKELLSLSIGKELEFGVDENNNLKQVSYPINALQTLVIDIEDQDIRQSQINDLPYHKKQFAVSGVITSSLYETAKDAGLSSGMIMQMIKVFGWDIDFAQDLRKGNSFHVIYDDYMMKDDKLADGDILAAQFTTQNQTYRAIRYTDPDGNTSYFNPQGKSMLGTFLRSPVEFSRISSRFGKRKHPILKTWRAHKGVDYAAPRGTPIRATADGTVTHARTKGGYGKTVILRHAGRFSTLYAHMNGYARGIRKGKRVKQGDVIGYIGTTGMSTGPHLHYEFRVDGVHRNPLTYKTPKASEVSKAHLADFRARSGDWLVKLNALEQQQLAQGTQLGQSAKQL